MTQPAILAENLGKEYQLGVRENGYRTLRESLVDVARAPFRRFKRLTGLVDERERFWALKDVSFEIQPGEVVGVIGRNGAGKSTLLKILCKITEPSEGSATIRGRIGSLLEVGTGFHPELTGRENVFLNGAVLGMPRVHIKRKFDEIVDFSGVEKFLDTPVKRYSSGMKVRLAFAVAAHLDPEILLIDEVLAVGDAEFQRKCLGKMGSVAKDGRTVLFVSHNMAAMEFLCSRGVVLDSGCLVFDGSPSDAVQRHLAASAPEAPRADLAGRGHGDGTGNAQFTKIEILNGDGRLTSVVPMGGEVRFRLHFTCGAGPISRPSFNIGLETLAGHRVMTFRSRYSPKVFGTAQSGGTVTCRVAELPLLPNEYHLRISMADTGVPLDDISNVATFVVVARDVHGSAKSPKREDGVCFAKCEWLESF